MGSIIIPTRTRFKDGVFSHLYLPIRKPVPNCLASEAGMSELKLNVSLRTYGQNFYIGI